MGPRRFPHRLFFYLMTISFFVCTASFAARVIAVQKSSSSVHVSMDENPKWHEGEEVCVFRNRRQIACGKIETVEKKYAVALLDAQNDDVAKRTVRAGEQFTFVELVFDDFPVRVGDRVKSLEEKKAPVRAAPRRSLSSLSIPEEIQPRVAPTPEEWSSNVNGDVFGDSHPSRFLASSSGYGKDDLYLESALKRNPNDPYPLSDISVGLNYIFPNIHYQQALSNHVSTGLNAMFLSAPVANGSLDGFGGYLTFTYYSESAFNGSMLELAAGLFSANSHVGGNTDNFITPAVMGIVGWRWLWDSGLNFGFGVGAQYLISVQSSSPALGFSGVLPCVALDLGFGF